MGAPALVVAPVIIDVIGAKRTARGYLRQNVLRKRSLAGIHFSRPRARATAAVMHRREQIWPGVEGQGGEDVAAGQMMLEGAALGSVQRACCVTVQVAHEVALAITGDAIAEAAVVH